MRRRRIAIAVLVAGALALSACTLPTNDHDAVGARPHHPSEPAAPTDPSAAAQLAATGAYVQGKDECLVHAEGPWTNRKLGADLFAPARAGQLPQLLGDDPDLSFELHEYPTVEDYNDPSTIHDIDALRDAWAIAGYQEALDWRHGEHEGVAAVALVRLRDDGGARAALSALAHDYCSKAVRSEILPDRSGMTVIRDTGAVRTMFVVDDTLVSIMTCACFGADLDQRALMVANWASVVMEVLATGKPSSSTT